MYTIIVGIPTLAEDGSSPRSPKSVGPVGSSGGPAGEASGPRSEGEHRAAPSECYEGKHGSSEKPAQATVPARPRRKSYYDDESDNDEGL